MPLKLDLHVHTKHSRDAFTTRKQLVKYSLERGLDGVAITDHDTIKGLKEFDRLGNLLVIPGIEVTTSQGHVLALNVTTCFKSGQSFSQTIDQIHDAGGLAAVAHPTTFFKGTSEEHLREDFDAMEVINAAAVPFFLSIRRNRKLAVNLKLPKIGGSDAHQGLEIGMAYTIVNSDINVDEVTKAIKKGHVMPVGKATPWSLRLRRRFLSIKKRWTWSGET